MKSKIYLLKLIKKWLLIYSNWFLLIWVVFLIYHGIVLDNPSSILILGKYPNLVIFEILGHLLIVSPICGSLGIISISTPIILAIFFTQLLSYIFFPILDQKFGIFLENNFLSLKDFYFIIIILLISIIVSVFPALQAYKNSINDGI